MIPVVAYFWTYGWAVKLLSTGACS